MKFFLRLFPRAVQSENLLPAHFLPLSDQPLWPLWKSSQPGISLPGISSQWDSISPRPLSSISSDRLLAAADWCVDLPSLQLPWRSWTQGGRAPGHIDTPQQDWKPQCSVNRDQTGGSWHPVTPSVTTQTHLRGRCAAEWQSGGPVAVKLLFGECWERPRKDFKHRLSSGYTTLLDLTKGRIISLYWFIACLLWTYEAMDWLCPLVDQ